MGRASDGVEFRVSDSWLALILATISVLIVLAFTVPPMFLGSEPDRSIISLEATSTAELSPGEIVDATTDQPVRCVVTGISAPGLWNELARDDLRRSMAETARLGTMVRVDFEWDRVESTEGTYVWNVPDRVLAAATENGLDVLVVLTNTPQWARGGDPREAGIHAKPHLAAEFADFAAAAVLRYGAKVVAWEVWNEPNSPIFWNNRPNIDEYADLLATTVTAIKAANPAAFVVSAGLSPADTRGWIYPPDFIRGLYASGVAQRVDAIGMHPYSYPGHPLANRSPKGNGWTQFRTEIRPLMISEGDVDKEVWMTEVGAPTGNSPLSLSESAQGVLYADLLASAATLSQVGPVLLYTIRDSGDDSKDPEQNFGVFTDDWHPKESLELIKAAVDKFSCRA